MLMLVLNREQALPFVVAIVLCTFMIVSGVYAVADAEFTRSLWATSGRLPPAITGLFAGAYKYVWITSFLMVIWGVSIIARKESSFAVIGWFGAAAAVQSTFWLMFMLLALYLANQTFKV